MESFNLNIQLNEEQKKYREECITFCMNDSFVLKFLEENDLDVNFVKNNSSKLKRWAVNKQVCVNCIGLEACKFNQGRYFELKYNDGFLEQVYAKCHYFKEEETKNERRDALMLVQQGISEELNAKKVGNIYEVLIEEQIEDKVYIGRTQGDAEEIDSIVYVKSENKLNIGDFVGVKITSALEYDLMGDIVNELA